VLSFEASRSPFKAPVFAIKAMAHQFAAGDNLVIQLESGFGILRVLAIDGGEHETVWHLKAYEELFPDIETVEAALAAHETLRTRVAHMALTERAFERTPAARLGNHPVSEDELRPYHDWVARNGEVSDRSALLMLGLR
jgi:hypothetical protein